jgi:predicted Zn-dependent protease
VEDPLGEARILANSGRLQDCIPMAKAAIAKDPDNAEGYAYLAEAYRGTGQADQVQATYDECARRATKGVAFWCPSGRKSPP